MPDKQFALQHIAPAARKQPMLHMVFLDAIEPLEALFPRHNLKVVVVELFLTVAHGTSLIPGVLFHIGIISTVHAVSICDATSICELTSICNAIFSCGI